MLTCVDFHYNRDFVVGELFKFHPAMVSYLRTKYEKVLNGPRETVSVHFRLSHAGEPDAELLSTRRQPSDVWYLRVIERYFDPSKHVFLFFTEDAAKLTPLIDELTTLYSAFSCIVVDENFALSMALMSMCKHHVVSTSMFSFWGMAVTLRLILTMMARRGVPGFQAASRRTHGRVAALSRDVQFHQDAFSRMDHHS